MCAEQHYWYRKGMIDEDIWQCWNKGMSSWYSSSILVKLIINDETTDAYFTQDFIRTFQRSDIGDIK